PAKEIRWTNPDGDGEFRITVSNPTKEPVTVPALLAAGDRILWGNSLLVIHYGPSYVDKPTVYTCAEYEPNPGPVKPVTLQPGEKVSGVINVLKLPLPDALGGGVALEFMFCLGERGVRKSFYYSFHYHDPIRQRLRSKD
ncbi:MAG: hypothetical protein NZ602_07235, partial [Thermoguttaceae bacterium]|nr:hypothetical protein [Thermoguttaceae bacterium]MDW8039182.1 hypothetical protein [Thermoguttaceae bacterium]